MTPTVLVDMDGPLADFDRHFYERCVQHGYLFDVPGPEHQSRRFFTDHMPSNAERKLAREMVNSSGWFAGLPVTPGAQEGLAELAQHADVWVCTKPLERNPTCRDEKAAWLVKHFGKEWERKLVLAPDKSMVRGDILLDDAPHLDWLARATWMPVMFPTPWNGANTPWGGFQRWGWDDSVERLVDFARRIARHRALSKFSLSRVDL